MGALFRTFCQKHRIRRLEVFGSVARGRGTAASDVDLLVTPDETHPPTTAELVDAPVDFVLRPSLEKSTNRFARDHILATAVCRYGD